LSLTNSGYGHGRSMDETDRMKIIGEEVSAAFDDVLTVNKVLWSGLAGMLDRKGILSEADFARWLFSVADQIEQIDPDHRLGSKRLDTMMLRSLADIITDPNPKPRWKPIVIEGDKKD
jgi:hypothetical protein